MNDEIRTVYDDGDYSITRSIQGHWLVLYADRSRGGDYPTMRFAARAISQDEAMRLVEQLRTGTIKPAEGA